MLREAGHPRHVLRNRSRVAAALAIVGLVAALVGALGPAERLRTIYSWPPPDLAVGAPSRLWYTPLLLSSHRPESVSANIPCSLPRALEPTADPVVVLATSRYPAQVDGLAVTRAGSRLVVRVGDDVLDRPRLRPGPAREGPCAYRLHLGGGSWWLYGGPDDLELSGRLGRMPTVTGLFSGLDLGSRVAPSIKVTTEAHASDTTQRQNLAWVVALLAIGSALLLIAVESRPRRSAAVLAGLVRAGVRQATPADLVVGLVLVVWLVISPAFWDDGHIETTERMYSSSGGFSFYYSALGANVPLGYWLDWTRHWLTESSTSLLVLRVPSLLCLAIAWSLCRWMLSRARGPGGRADAVALWALTGAFLTGALAWGMTLRPEPVTGLLAGAVMACALHFRERGSAAPLALAAVIVPLALSAHHTGVVALAPLLAGAPGLIRWGRSRWPAAATLATASLALLLVLAVVGSDIEQRRADAEATRAAASEPGWRDEAARYLFLSEAPYGTPLRRASVALILLAIMAFFARRRWNGRSALLDYPGVTLLAALGLLVLTPSKWPWHFGALLAIASVAVAVESARVRDEAARRERWSRWPFLAVGAACLAAAWSWWPRTTWGGIDLRTLDWTPELEAWFPLSRYATALPLVVLAAGLVLGRRRGAAHVRAIPWRVASWTTALVAGPLLVFTVAVLVADVARTPGWTLTRQNLGSLRGEQGCGLADELAVPALGSVEQLPSAVPDSDAPSEPSWGSTPPVPHLPRFLLTPGAGTSAATPWFSLPAGGRAGFGFFVSGTPQSSDRLALEWGRDEHDKVVELGASALAVDLASDAGAGTAPWRLLAGAELPPPVSDATSARVKLRAGHLDGAPLVVTPLVTYEGRSLAGLVRGSTASTALVLPELVTYFPCLRQPRLRNGVVEAPGHIVTMAARPHPLEYRGTSPFDGVLDLYRLNRLPVADPRRAPDLAFFTVDHQIPGARRLPPVEESST